MVHIQTHRTVQVRHRLTCHRTGVAFVSDEAAYDQVVLLLYPRLVFLRYARERVNLMSLSSQ